MFFYLAKIFWFVAQPISLAILLPLIGLLLTALKWKKLGVSLIALGPLLLALGAWTSLGALALQPLEDKYKRPESQQDIAGIIVLGGGFEGGVNKARGGYELNAGGDRMVEAAILARRFPAAKVLISGGSGALLIEGEGDAETGPRLLEALGVDRSRMILENESRDTYENAVFSRKLVEPKPGETWLLVTSAFHMPRSMGLFRKAGFDVTPWPSDYRTTGNETLGPSKDNIVDTLRNSSVAIREWMGLVAYRLSGRTDQLIP